ncbi:glycoside hydrolase family 43 protein [Niabella ginsengisoli]|uniref:Glycoside hydrolase family 43 protein n=1 Tax=Niabella ginsengisoli TaxID=522298 RepID=A0ABS9SFL2_9BACT|nr:glycoside hydrolase family 43 protein [Niabella ginsengisoli]MCH5597147.1 glycoside hydrolase family 43 protein [Niabella ginsengisoli]
MLLNLNIRKYSTGLLLFIVLQLLITKTYAQTKEEQNPLVADPTIFLDNSTYYLYGTGGGNKDNGFKVFTSTDQKQWKDRGFALKKSENYGSKGFWAPQVFKHGNKYYMAYTASEHIAVSIADSPLGPFTQKAKIPLDSNTRMIDPFIWIDPSGTIYLYHVRLQKGNRIFVAEMNKELTSIKNETLKECIVAKEGWEDTQNAEWKVAEGPTILKHKDLYYLIYSANDFRNPDYAVGYAISKTLLGPWKKFEGNPIISRQKLDFNGTGHGDVVIDKKGKMWYVFHTHNIQESVAPRKTAIIELRFEKQGNGLPDKIIALPKTFRFLEKTK